MQLALRGSRRLGGGRSSDRRGGAQPACTVSHASSQDGGAPVQYQPQLEPGVCVCGVGRDLAAERRHAGLVLQDTNRRRAAAPVRLYPGACMVGAASRAMLRGSAPVGMAQRPPRAAAAAGAGGTPLPPPLAAARQPSLQRFCSSFWQLCCVSGRRADEARSEPGASTCGPVRTRRAPPALLAAPTRGAVACR